MSIFDRLKRTAPASGNASPSEYKKETFRFAALPESLSPLQAFPEAQLWQKGDGKWLLWEQYLMPDIRPPKSLDPWRQSVALHRNSFPCGSCSA